MIGHENCTMWTSTEREHDWLHVWPCGIGVALGPKTDPRAANLWPESARCLHDEAVETSILRALDFPSPEQAVGLSGMREGLPLRRRLRHRSCPLPVLRRYGLPEHAVSQVDDPEERRRDAEAMEDHFSAWPRHDKPRKTTSGPCGGTTSEPLGCS